MSDKVDFLVNAATFDQIVEHLLYCDADFVPSLHDRVDVPNYVKKIVNESMRFEAWSNGTLVGLVAAYCNDQATHVAYVTNVSVLKKWTGNGIAACLIAHFIAHANAVGMREINLEVAAINTRAVSLYQRSGFVLCELDEALVRMTLNLELQKR